MTEAAVLSFNGVSSGAFEKLHIQDNTYRSGPSEGLRISIRSALTYYQIVNPFVVGKTLDMGKNLVLRA